MRDYYLLFGIANLRFAFTFRSLLSPSAIRFIARTGRLAVSLCQCLVPYHIKPETALYYSGISIRERSDVRVLNSSVGQQQKNVTRFGNTTNSRRRLLRLRPFLFFFLHPLLSKVSYPTSGTTIVQT